MSARAAADSATRATTAITGPDAPTHLTTLTSFTSPRRASIHLTSQIVTTASRCVAWLAGSSAGCRIWLLEHNRTPILYFALRDVYCAFYKITVVVQDYGITEDVIHFIRICD